MYGIPLNAIIRTPGSGAEQVRLAGWTLAGREA